EEPEKEFHFETGRPLAERPGYPVAELDAIPAPSIESFAGVGYYFDLAALQLGETVVDLGSGSGMDSFLAAHQVGDAGRVIGDDMQRDDYREAIESAGFEIEDIHENDQYLFVSERADNATQKYGVKSVSLLAAKR